jgi:hypothetical protein
MKQTQFVRFTMSVLFSAAALYTPVGDVVMAQSAPVKAEPTAPDSVRPVLVFTPQGVGQWQVGRGLMSIPASALSIHYSSELDTWDENTPLSGAGCETAGVRAQDGLSLMIESGIVTRVEMRRPSSEEGTLGHPSFTPMISGAFTVGGQPFAPFTSNVADARAAFGPALREEPHPYVGDEGSYLILYPESTPGFGLIMETVGNDITRFRVGNSETIQYIEGCL